MARLAPWAVYAVAAAACTKYLNDRAALVPRIGQWYMASEGDPYVLLQVRALLAGHLAVAPHPSGVGNDYDWGRGGMHQAWGLGLPLLATPFHLIGRLFGAPGFPDDLRFLLLFAATVFVLARALNVTSDRDPMAQVTSAIAAALFMLMPTFVGMVSARFLVYEQTIAVGVLWDVLLLSGVLLLVARCTPGRLALLCAAAGFSLSIRPPLAVYGACTVAMALVIAARKGLDRRALVTGAAAYLGVSALYFAGNALRYGSPFDLGYENCVSGWYVNRLERWGLPFAHVPFAAAAKEMFATLFLLDPVGSPVPGALPPSVQPYVTGERWREYYTPTFDLGICVVVVASWAIAVAAVVRGRLWRSDRALDGEVPAIIGVWGIGPALVLFVFYARIGNMVTRYVTDMVPAFAAGALCVALTLVHAARRRSHGAGVVAALVVGLVASWYVGRASAWPKHMSRPVDRATVVAKIAEIDRASVFTQGVPSHFQSLSAHGPLPMDAQLKDWQLDGLFPPGMVFAMPHTPCVAFTFLPHDADGWPDGTLATVRATADADSLVRCGPPRVDGPTRTLTMCEPRPPPYLLDGMRLYSVASLDAKLDPAWLKLVRIDAAASCP